MIDFFIHLMEVAFQYYYGGLVAPLHLIKRLAVNFPLALGKTLTIHVNIHRLRRSANNSCSQLVPYTQ